MKRSAIMFKLNQSVKIPSHWSGWSRAEAPKLLHIRELALHRSVILSLKYEAQPIRMMVDFWWIFKNPPLSLAGLHKWWNDWAMKCQFTDAKQLEHSSARSTTPAAGNFTNWFNFRFWMIDHKESYFKLNTGLQNQMTYIHV